MDSVRTRTSADIDKSQQATVNGLGASCDDSQVANGEIAKQEETRTRKGEREKERDTASREDKKPGEHFGMHGDSTSSIYLGHKFYIGSRP